MNSQIACQSSATELKENRSIGDTDRQIMFIINSYAENNENMNKLQAKLVQCDILIMLLTKQLQLECIKKIVEEIIN